MQKSLLLLGLFSSVCASVLNAADPAKKPNIIFILCDDLGYGDVGVFFQNQRAKNNKPGQPWHITPQIDTLATTGVQMPHHYCPAPVCAPSRASLLTGVHQGQAVVRDNQFDKALEDNHTLASVLKQAGYATAAIGKWGLQGQGETAQEWPAHPLKRGFDFYYGYIRHKDGHAQFPKEDAKEVWENYQEVSPGLDKCYTTDLFTARAKKWITDQRTANPEQPFFVYLAYATPHAKLQLPSTAYPEGGGLKGGLQWLGTPGKMINTAEGEVDGYVHPDYAKATWDHDTDPATPEVAWPDVQKRYATDVRRIDDCVGDVLHLLKDLKIDDNTLVVFTTDNGPSKESYLKEAYHPTFFDSYGPFDGIKRDLWEGGIRVGALVRWPAGAPAGRVSDVPSTFADWLPTFADLAGLPAPARSTGVSLVPTITGKSEQKQPLVYVEYSQNEKTPAYAEFEKKRQGHPRKQMQAIRLGNLMGVRYNVASHSDPFEIYDVVADPKQTKNLAESKADLQQQMKDAVLRVRRPNPSAKRPYDEELVPAVSSGAVTNGIEWSAYLQEFPWVADFSTLTPTANGGSPYPSAVEKAQGTPAGMLFTGYIEVPADGSYTFHLTADTGAVLELHDATVIDADKGYVGGTEASGSIRLQKGKHPFRLFYTRRGDVKPTLSMQWSSDNIKKQPIPETAFFRKADAGTSRLSESK